MKIQKKQEIEFFGTKTGNANSIALGYATETKNFGEVAVGVMNKSIAAKDPNSSKGVCVDPDATLFSVGCGGSGERKNALEVKGDGSVIIPGENGNINIADKIKQAFDTDASIELVKSAENSLQYTLMVNNEARGSINIPKDQFLKNVTYDPDGKQLVFTFVTLDEDEHVERVPVGDLKDIYTAGEGITINGDNVISANFSSVMAAISDEKTLRETTDNEIKSTLDTKSDLNKAGYVKVEQLTPAITYDEETNSINGAFRFIKLDKLDNIVKNENLANGWQYYDFDDMLDDFLLPQYIYDATADEHIEITDSTYLNNINDGNGGDAFNTVKPLDLTHDLYLDNEQIGTLSKIRKLDFLKDTIKNSIFVGGEIVPDLEGSDIDHSIIFQSLNDYSASNLKIKNSIIIGAGENLSVSGNTTSADNIILSTQGDNITNDKCVLIGHCENIDTLKNGSVLIGQNTLAQGNCISIGSLCSNKNGIVIGRSSQAGINSVTIGDNANVYEYHNDNVCIGYSTKCNRYSVAVGKGATATGEKSIAIGSVANSKNKYSISIGSSLQSVVSNPYIIFGNFARLNAPNDYSYYCIGGYKDDTTYYNIEETLTYSNQHKKYIYGIGGYDGTNSATEGIKSLQEVLADKADASAIPTKLSQLTNDINVATPNDAAIFAGLTIHNNAKIRYIQKTGGDEGTYLIAETPADRVANKVFAADGSLFDVSKLVKKVQCSVSGDPNNIEFGYTTVDGTYNFSVIPTVTTSHSGIMSPVDKVKLDALPSITAQLNNITAASTAEEVVTKFNALLADLKAKGYMKADE